MKDEEQQAHILGLRIGDLALCLTFTRTCQQYKSLVELVPAIEFSNIKALFLVTAHVKFRPSLRL